MNFSLRNVPFVPFYLDRGGPTWAMVVVFVAIAFPVAALAATVGLGWIGIFTIFLVVLFLAAFFYRRGYSGGYWTWDEEKLQKATGEPWSVLKTIFVGVVVFLSTPRGNQSYRMRL